MPLDFFVLLFSPLLSFLKRKGLLFSVSLSSGLTDRMRSAQGYIISSCDNSVASERGA